MIGTRLLAFSQKMGTYEPIGVFGMKRNKKASEDASDKPTKYKKEGRNTKKQKNLPTRHIKYLYTHIKRKG